MGERDLRTALFVTPTAYASEICASTAGVTKLDISSVGSHIKKSAIAPNTQPKSTKQLLRSSVRKAARMNECRQSQSSLCGQIYSGVQGIARPMCPRGIPSDHQHEDALQHALQQHDELEEVLDLLE